jgi:hypothetical protein
VFVCSIVEFGTREEALRAITELNEQVLMGRPVYLREVSQKTVEQSKLHPMYAESFTMFFRIVKTMPAMGPLLSRTDQASQVLLCKYPMKVAVDLLLEFQLHSPLLDHEVSSSPE